MAPALHGPAVLAAAYADPLRSTDMFVIARNSDQELDQLLTLTWSGAWAAAASCAAVALQRPPLTAAGGSSTDGGVFSSQGDSFVEELDISSAVASDFNYDGMLDVYAPTLPHSALFLHFCALFSTPGLGTHVPFLPCVSGPSLWVRRHRSAVLTAGSLVQGRTNSSSFMNVYFGNLKTLSAPVEVPSPPDAADQVLLLDANMDMKVDLFGMDANGTRTFWINAGDGKTWSTVPLPGSEGLPPIDMPHSNAFVDINGDCLSDLVITSNNGTNRFLEVWLNSDASGTPEFTLTEVLDLPEGAGQVTFSDLGASRSALPLPDLFPLQEWLH